MSKIMIRTFSFFVTEALIFTFAFAMPLISSAEDIYIAQTALGSDTGVDSANAHSVNWFNTSTLPPLSFNSFIVISPGKFLPT